MSQYNHLRESLSLTERRTPLNALENQAQQYSQDLDRTLQRIRGLQQALEDGAAPAKRQYEIAYDKLIAIGDKVRQLGETARNSIKTGDPDALASVDLISYYSEGWRFQRVQSMENKATRAARNKIRAAVATGYAVRDMIRSIMGAVDASRGPRDRNGGERTDEMPVMAYEGLVQEFSTITEAASPARIKTRIDQQLPASWKKDTLKQKYWRELFLLSNEVQDIAFFATEEDENWEEVSSRLGELVGRIRKLKQLADKIKGK